MGWSNTNIDTLVIPTGATSGARIVLNGLTGDITIYDSSNNIVATLNSSGFKAYGTGAAAGAETSIEPANATLGTALVLTPATQSGVTWVAGGIDATQDLTSEHRPELVISPPNISGLTWPTIVLIGEGLTDNRRYIDLDADVITAYNVNTGTEAALNLLITGTPAGNRAISFRKDTDANDSFFIDYNGNLQWGPGGASVLDTLLTRSSAGALTMFGDLNASAPGSSAGTEETWHTPTYGNNWSAGSGATLQYRKLASPAKAVQLCGSIHSPNPFVSVGVFTLPTGYRPAATQYLLATRDTAVTAQLKITSSGVVSLENNVTPGIDWYINGIFQTDR